LGGLSAFVYFHNAPILQDHPFCLDMTPTPLFDEDVTDSSKKRRSKKRKTVSVVPLSSFETPS